MRKQKPIVDTNPNKVRYYHKIFKEPYDMTNPIEVQIRTLAVEKLEEELNVNFQNTRYFNAYMGNWLKKHKLNGAGLKTTRKKEGLTQGELAKKLRTKQSNVSLMERNQRPLTKDAKDYIIGVYREETPVQNHHYTSIPLWYSRKMAGKL